MGSRSVRCSGKFGAKIVLVNDPKPTTEPLLGDKSARKRAEKQTRSQTSQPDVRLAQNPRSSGSVLVPADFSRQFRTGGGRASLMRSKDNETRIKAAKLSHQPQLPSSHRQKPARKCRTGPTLQLSGSHAVRKERIPLRRRPTNARVLHKSKHDTSEALGAAANQRGDPPERHRMQPIGGEYAAV